MIESQFGVKVVERVMVVLCPDPTLSQGLVSAFLVLQSLNSEQDNEIGIRHKDVIIQKSRLLTQHNQGHTQ